MQASGSHDQNQASTIGAQVQDQQQMASLSSQPNDQPSASNQVQVLQPINVFLMALANQCCKRSSIGLYNWRYFKRCAN